MKRIQTLERKQRSYQTILERETIEWNRYVKGFVKDTVDGSRTNLTNNVCQIGSKDRIEKDD